MKIAVTGASGQLGTALLRKLALDRKVEAIVALDIRPPLVAIKKVRYLHADVRDEAFERFLEGCDALVHFAFIVTDWVPREVMEAVNVEGSKNVFRAAIAAGVKNIVYASSVAAYGIFPDHPMPIGEDTPRRRQPAVPYAANKYDVEHFLDDFERAHPSVAIARLRPAILVGARMEHAFGRVLDARLMPDLGWPPLPVVWDEDVAAAAVLCLQKQARGAFNLVADESLPSSELARVAGFRRVPVPRAAVLAATRLNPLLEKIGQKPLGDPSWVEGELPRLVYTSDKAKTELGWKPKYPTAADVFRKLGDVARGRTDPRLPLLFRFIGAAAKRMPSRPDLAHQHADIHLDLTGPGGGDFALHLRDGRLAIEPGVPRPPTSVLSMDASVFRDLLADRVSAATLQITGKTRVEGEPIVTLLLAGIASMFREAQEQPGLRGKSARRLAAWITAP